MNNLKANNTHGQKLVDAVIDLQNKREKAVEKLKEIVISLGFVGYQERCGYVSDYFNNPLKENSIPNQIKLFWIQPSNLSGNFSKTYKTPKIGDKIAFIDKFEVYKTPIELVIKECTVYNAEGSNLVLYVTQQEPIRFEFDLE